MLYDGLGLACISRAICDDHGTLDPDLDVQFVFGTKKTQGLALERISDEQAAFEQYQPEIERHVMLVLNAVDLHTQKPVFRVTASRRESDGNLPQPEFDRVIEKLLSTFPVGR